MDKLLKVTGQVNAALVSLAADQPDVKDILEKLPQVVVIGSQVSWTLLGATLPLPCPRYCGLNSVAEAKTNGCGVFDGVYAAQSAGKSSLLEAFINQAILPKGEGMVTKRPIIIRLVTAPTVTMPTVTFDDPRAKGVPGGVPISDTG